MRGVHVAHLEARPLAGQAARAQRRDAPLVRDLRQRVHLIHELRQLRGAVELLDHRRHRLGVDQILRHQAFGLGKRQPLAHRAVHAHQADAELVLDHLADAAHAPVAQVIAIIDRALAVLDVDQPAQHRDDVFLRQHARTGGLGATDAAVELHAADAGQVVQLAAEEQVLEQRFGGVAGRRLARAHDVIDLDQRVLTTGGVVHPQRVRDVGAAVDVVHVQHRQLAHAGGAQLLQQAARRARRWPRPGSRRWSASTTALARTLPCT